MINMCLIIIKSLRMIALWAICLIFMSCAKSNIQAQYGEGIVGSHHMLNAGGVIYLYEVSEPQNIKQVFSVVTNLGFVSCSVKNNAFSCENIRFRPVDQKGLNVNLSFKIDPTVNNLGIKIIWVAKTDRILVTEEAWENWNEMLKIIRHVLQKEADKVRCEEIAKQIPEKATTEYNSPGESVPEKSTESGKKVQADDGGQ